MSELPEDLSEHILCRVPTTSLVRFRATCKPWNRLFNDRRFARKHFDKATKQSLILMLKEGSIMRTNLHRFFSPENLSLTELHSSLDQSKFLQVFHCDGLLLCLTKDKKHNTRLVVWNPCTGQTKWIITHHKQCTTYALGSYQDQPSDDIGYKILSRKSGHGDNIEFKIYETNSDSWRILDVTIDFSFLDYLDSGLALKGKTYWIARDEKEGHVDEFLLVSFDYTTERFERLSLPRQHPSYRNVSLSVVREEKLAVLFQRQFTWKNEIWVTNKIGGETNGVTWSMFLVVDFGPRFVPWYGGSFLIDEEEKKFLHKGKTMIRIVGEDKEVKQVDFVADSSLFNFVPSLIQI